MKKSKKILAGLMAFTVCFGGSSALVPEGIIPAVAMAESTETAKSGTCGENLTWVLDDEGILTISGTGDMEDYLDDAPWYSERGYIKETIIEDGVTSIGSFAFSGCSGLTEITIPDSVTSIGSDAFYDTPWLEAKQKENPFVIVNGILIDGKTCSGDVVIPDSVTSIGDHAFSRSKILKSVVIPDSVTSIGNSAFYYCKNLTSVTIPDSVTNIGVTAFQYCSSLTEITIPDSVTDIGASAFSDCTGLTSVTISDSVTRIALWVFRGCSGLTEITIPDSVTSIGGYVFSDCTNLEKITILNPECKIYDYSSTISNGGENSEYYFNGTIFGYANSTAQAYAEKYNYKFESIGEAPVFDSGDVNNDGYIDSVDATAILVEYAVLSTSGNSTMNSAAKKSADVNGDGFRDSVDATLISSYYANVSAGKNVTFSEFIENVKNV